MPGYLERRKEEKLLHPLAMDAGVLWSKAEKEKQSEKSAPVGNFMALGTRGYDGNRRLNLVLQEVHIVLGLFGARFSAGFLPDNRRPAGFD